MPAAKDGKQLADKMIDLCGEFPGGWHPELEEVHHQDQVQV